MERVKGERVQNSGENKNKNKKRKKRKEKNEGRGKENLPFSEFTSEEKSFLIS
jgi:hypothetical protein